ncbi:polysaccharide lyase family 7 protein [Pseudomonas sp. KNUC1026]|uniref:polysaccharide lyase family 7 protein n=1 Tax=Pseudomonas sp. KNUC1026 TaxID=2893890 RepID=UPI001F1F3E06|nr:polysaccharide lyase family 7 protein [Pseudomonas sp. KNUC1026]UFH48370.1 polysaccharide lyase family 7 protein [Pseudomonas sp. KNUC1026]
MIDLAVWNLSIPVGSPPKTVETPQLTSGYNDKYFNSKHGQLFFWAPVTGAKTANAIYPRTELRETFKDGQLRNWKYTEANNMLRAQVTVSKVPSSGKVVIGQIHCYESTRPLLKLEYQYSDGYKTGKIVAKLRRTPSEKHAQVITVAEDVPMNTRFNYMIHLGTRGDLSVTARNKGYSTKIGSAWKNETLYFKAGVYTQDNTGYSSEGGQVLFSQLKAVHTVN